MIWRTAWHVLVSRFGRRLAHFDVARTVFRVLPTDLDILRHMNNGVYLSIFDIGRFDLLRRSGIWQIFLQRGWYPVVASETITFRKSLTLGQKFEVESRILGFDERAVYVEQRAVVRRGDERELYAQAFIRGRFLRRAGGTVSMAELLDAVGAPPASAQVPEWLLRWGEDARMPSTRVAAPSLWDRTPR